MAKENENVLALFYCRNTPESGESIRQDLEEKYQGAVRFFPLPCSGRLDPVHLLRALEEFADAAYIITCPVGACRYFEGNRRAKKRVARTQELLGVIGLENERIGMVANEATDMKTLTVLASEIKAKTDPLGRSPVHKGSEQMFKKAS